jgi:hypothetical protein
VTAGADSSACIFTFDFDFTLPQACIPQAEIGTVTTTTLDCGADAAATVDVGQGVTGSSACIFTFDFDFSIPKGCDGSDGSDGINGSNGANGSDGIDGIDGSDGGDGATGPTGPPGPPGPPGQDGQDGDKYAIVPMPLPQAEGTPPEYMGLICAEMPEVRFEDVLVVPIPTETPTMLQLDPLFVGACEPDSIQVVGLVPTTPVVLGAAVLNGYLMVERAEDTDNMIYGDVVVRVSGIRKGRDGVRFPRFSENEFEKNTQFWSGWNR